MQGLGFLPNGGTHDSYATAASADGSTIVGVIGNNFTGVSKGAFIWNDDMGMRRLDDVLIDDFGLGVQLQGWTLSTAMDVSADGLTVVGEGVNPDGNEEGWIAVLSVPDLVGDCSGDGVLNVADLACAKTIEDRDAVLLTLNTLPGDLDGNGDVSFADFWSCRQTSDRTYLATQTATSICRRELRSATSWFSPTTLERRQMRRRPFPSRMVSP